MLGPFIFSKISEVMKPKEKKPTSFEIEKKPTEEENQPKQLKNQPNFYSDPNIHSHLNPKEKFNGKSNGNSENSLYNFPNEENNSQEHDYQQDPEHLQRFMKTHSLSFTENTYEFQFMKKLQFQKELKKEESIQSGFIDPSKIEEQAQRPIKLFKNIRERENIDNQANLFSIINTVEHLEKALSSDAITSEQYTMACSRLITQFKTALTVLSFSHKDVLDFLKYYNVKFPSATHTLIEIGLPSTIEYARSSEKENNSGHIAECVAFFITAMDSIKLNMIAADQIAPNLSEIYTALSKISSLPDNFIAKEKTKEWISTLNPMKAHEELSPDQARQLLYDLESSYSALMEFLKKK